MKQLINQQQPPSVKIWSYNVFLRPPPIKNNSDDYKSERFILILDLIRQYDIVCFQELFQTGSFRVEDLIATAINSGFNYWCISEPVSFWGPTPVDSGLLVISRYPIIKKKFYSFNIGIFSDSASDKGYIYCKIDINGDILHLFNLHLQASYLNPDKTSYHKELSLAARRHQCSMLKRQMKQVLRKEYDEKDLILLIGDFNINAHEEKQCLEKNSLIKAFIPEEFHQYAEFIQLMEGHRDNQYILETQYKVRDILLENYGYHPTTYGQEALMILTHKDEYGIPQRLDYLFQIQPKSPKPSLMPVVSSCVVEKAKVEGQAFTQLSDHYGISLTLAPSMCKK